MWRKFLEKLVRFLDKKVEKYREPAEVPEVPKFAPKSLEEFVDVIKRTPKNVLSLKDRERIAGVMSFEQKRVGDIMIPKKEMVFVDGKELLGPLVLDKLYKSGFMVFPVTDGRGKIKGIIRTEALNALEIKKTDRAEKYMDTNVRHLKTSDSLETLVYEIKNSGSTFFLVDNDAGELMGFVTVNTLLDYLLP